MESDTEIPTAPPAWAESIHGDLVLVDRVRVDAWEQLETDAADPNDQVIAEGRLHRTDRGAGMSFRLPTMGSSSLTTLTAHGPIGYVITDLSGEGDEALRDLVASIPDDAYRATGATIEVGFLGFVLFDGASSWEMVAESMLYVVLEVPSGHYRADLAETELGSRSVRVVRLTRV